MKERLLPPMIAINALVVVFMLAFFFAPDRTKSFPQDPNRIAYPPRSDINQDGTVNLLDFNIMAQEWLKPTREELLVIVRRYQQENERLRKAVENMRIDIRDFTHYYLTCPMKDPNMYVRAEFQARMWNAKLDKAKKDETKITLENYRKQ